MWSSNAAPGGRMGLFQVASQSGGEEEETLCVR